MHTVGYGYVNVSHYHVLVEGFYFSFTVNFCICRNLPIVMFLINSLRVATKMCLFLMFQRFFFSLSLSALVEIRPSRNGIYLPVFRLTYLPYKNVP